MSNDRLADAGKPMPADTPTAAEVAAGRMQRKLARRDQRIAGLVRRVAALESALATRAVDVERLPRDVKWAVQAALCNVRMIPVLDVGQTARIVEVKVSEASK